METSLTSFDYANDARKHTFHKLLEVRVPRHLHGGFTALAGACAILAGASGIEAHRLRDAIELQSVYQTRFDASVRAVRRVNVYRERVRKEAVLARNVRAIAASGHAEARRLAAIAASVPRHAWLTAISGDGNATRLEGQARDWDALSEALRRFELAARASRPELVTASLSSERPKQSTVKYALTLRGLGQ